MKDNAISRRKALGGLTGLAGLTLVSHPLTATSPTMLEKKKNTDHSFTFCLNTSTVMGQELGLVKEIELAASTGYDGIEIWIRSIDRYVGEGGNLKDLKKRIDDLGIKVENAIGFAQWIVDDNDTRTQALEQAKKEMDQLAQLGCPRLAAPPAGATNIGGLDLMRAAERFRTLVELGLSMDVIPQLEIWGFSKNLYRLSQVVFVAAECGHPQTRILPDIYHLHKGGSDFDGLKLLSGRAVEIFHVNDYPDTISREEIADKDRVFPGDGVAPIASVLKDLHEAGGPTVLSLELFNRDYWAMEASEVARTGLEKMKASVEEAVGS